jgi:hypothetical protein
MGKYSEQVGYPGTNFLYPGYIRSRLSCCRAGLYKELIPKSKPEPKTLDNMSKRGKF